jgi:hypothetical protein
VSQHIELDAYVLPDDHSVFKLFPGKTYGFNKAIVDKKMAFLDIRGLDRLSDDPRSWTDAEMRQVITQDRITRGAVVKRGVAQDTKRLRFLKNLFFVAKKGDLVVVPLGQGLEGGVALGEFSEAPGIVRRAVVEGKRDAFETWGRAITWKIIASRDRFTHALNRSLANANAFHTLEQKYREELYLAAYASFTYDNIYVASFPSEKERFTTTDQANIGIWFNGIAVIHDRAAANGTINEDKDFYELGLEESAADLELAQNSPWTVIMRTIGPLAFSTQAIYPLAAAGEPLNSLRGVTVSARTVGAAVDKCKVTVPPDMEDIANGSGLARWRVACKVVKRVADGATVRAGKGDLKLKRKEPN